MSHVFKNNSKINSSTKHELQCFHKPFSYYVSFLFCLTVWLVFFKPKKGELMCVVYLHVQDTQPMQSRLRDVFCSTKPRDNDQGVNAIVKGRIDRSKNRAIPSC